MALSLTSSHDGASDTGDRVKMTCPSCQYQCVPQWLNDEATCLKCFTVLRRRACGAGAGAGTALHDAGARRLPGEACTFKLAPSDAREFEGGECAKGPKGVHLYRFGKCSYCARPEPAGQLALASRPTPARTGSRAGSKPRTDPSRFDFSLAGQDCAEGRARRPSLGDAFPTPPCSSSGSRRPSLGDAVPTPSGSRRPSLGDASGARARSNSRTGSKAMPRMEGHDHEEFPMFPEPRGVAEPKQFAARNDRTKVECPSCGYKCVPQWLNDRAHCLKCQAVLKVQDTVHHSGGFSTSATDGARRASGEVSTFKTAPGDAMLHSSGTCGKSPDGMHLWRFGRCDHCGVAEGKMLSGAGACANPGASGGAGCAAGGKCMFKFAKCTKCGKKQF